VKRFEVSLVSEQNFRGDRKPIRLAENLPADARSIPPQRFDGIDPWKYVLRVEGYAEDREASVLVKGEVVIQLEPKTETQVLIEDILPSTRSRAHIAVQMVNRFGKELTELDGMRNDDFIHVESMKDEEGRDLRFTSRHEHGMFKYKVDLNRPVPPGRMCLFSMAARKDAGNTIRRVPGTVDEFKQSSNHMPGVNGPIRRVEIYRLPRGAELLETTPADMPHRIRDGRVELMVDTIIPTAGRQFTQFRYRYAHPDALFPELEGCRLKYSAALELKALDEPVDMGRYSFYQSDQVVFEFKVDPALENRIERFEFSAVPVTSRNPARDRMVWPASGSIREGFADALDRLPPEEYNCRLMAYSGANLLAQATGQVEIKPAMMSQLGMNEIQPDGDIRFISAQQTPNLPKKVKSRGFVNSDFVHIKNMFDGDGEDVEFSETHEGNHYRYRAKLNTPAPAGGTLLLGSEGWMESLIRKVPGADGEFRYRMNHSPSTGVAVRRVEIFRLPKGAELLATTPPDLPHHLRDGQVEILVDAIIPAGGSLLTEFTYRLADRGAKVAVEDAALRLLAAMRDKQDGVLRELSIDRNEGWRDALPAFSFECRERFRQLAGSPFDMRVDTCRIQGDFAAVKCVGPDALNGIYLVLFFERTGVGWKNISMKNSPPSTSLDSHLADLLETAAKLGWETHPLSGSEEYAGQIIELKRKAETPAQRQAVEQIGRIIAGASFHQGALVQLAGIAAGAPVNHQRIVKAAELASSFGYHAGALIEVAKIAAAADHECGELDEILELVVLTLGGTVEVMDLAQDTVRAESEAELAGIHERIGALRDAAEYLTLEEALEDQKTLFDGVRKMRSLNLQPAPWPDGEVLRYRLLTKAGMEVGSQIWNVNSASRDGQDCWSIEQRLVVPSSGAIMASQVLAEKESFAPLTGFTKHQLGEVRAEYFPGKVLMTAAGQDAPRQVTVPGIIFDNEQALYLMRRLPLADQYRAEFPIMSVLSGTSSLECRVRVMGRENIEGASEPYGCSKVRIQVYAGPMKAIEQTAWFAVEGHVPVRFVTDQLDMELAGRSAADASLETMELKEHGVALHLPPGWYGYELPTSGKEQEIVRLLPPDMKLQAMLHKTMRTSGSSSPKSAANQDIKMLQGYYKKYTVRDDSRRTLYADGLKTAYVYAADYEDQEKNKVEYRAYFSADARIFWFVFRMDREDFESVRDELDEVIDGLRIIPDPDGGITPYSREKNFRIHIDSPGGSVPFVCRANVADSQELAGEYQTPVTLESTRRRLDVTIISPHSDLLNCELQVDGNERASCGGSTPWRVTAGKHGEGVGGDNRLQQFFVQMKVSQDGRPIGETKFALYQKKATRIQLDGYSLAVNAATEPQGNVILKMHLYKDAGKGKARLLASPVIKTRGGEDAGITMTADGAPAYTVEVATTEL
jgi:hypothetical protein